MKKYFTVTLLTTLFIFLVSCSEHSEYTITEFAGDYRDQAGIGEFYDCTGKTKYFVAKSGIYKELQEKFATLNLNDNDDAYIKVEGYIKKEELMGGIGTVDIFVVTKLLSIDPTRGCEKRTRQGY